MICTGNSGLRALHLRPVTATAMAMNGEGQVVHRVLVRHALSVAAPARSDNPMSERDTRVDDDGVGWIDHRRLIRGRFLAIIAYRRGYRSGDYYVTGLDRELGPVGHDLRRAVLGAAVDSHRRFGLERERTGLHRDKRNHWRAGCTFVALTTRPRRKLHLAERAYSARPREASPSR